MPTPRRRTATATATPDYVTRYLAVGADDSHYMPALRGAYDFFRRNSDGRYSDSTLVRLSRAWDSVQYLDSRPQDAGTSNLPVIIIADAPYTYDEETEVKRGGTLGMMVIWPEKSILAVNRLVRHVGIGARLFEQANYYGHTPAMWVGRGNTIGHMFCLRKGLYPTAMNGSGAVRYASGGEEDDA